MFAIDDRQIKKYEKDLKAFKAKAYPFATRDTINTNALQTREEAHKIVEDKFTLRNNFTKRGIQANLDKQNLVVARQEASTGSVDEYMAEQEFGQVHSATGKYGVPIPTSYAAGQPEDQRPRTKAVRPTNRRGRIRLSKQPVEYKGRRTRNVQKVLAAAQSGHKHVFLELSKRKGFFRIEGGKQRPRLKMVADLSKRNVSVSPHRWLQPAT